MERIGFTNSQPFVAQSTHRDRGQHDSTEDVLVVRDRKVIRWDGNSELDLTFALCVWGADGASGIGIHPTPEATVAHLAHVLAEHETLREMLTDACRFGRFLAAAAAQERRTSASCE